MTGGYCGWRKKRRLPFQRGWYKGNMHLCGCVESIQIHGQQKKGVGGFPHTLHAGIVIPLGLREQPLWKLRVQLTGVFAEPDFY